MSSDKIKTMAFVTHILISKLLHEKKSITLPSSDMITIVDLGNRLYKFCSNYEWHDLWEKKSKQENIYPFGISQISSGLKGEDER